MTTKQMIHPVCVVGTYPNHQGITIVDVEGKSIKGCATFQYKNHTISFSTILPTNSIGIFDHTENTPDIFISGEVKDAIEYIDNLVKEKK